jgi:hypothetical protein
LSDGTEDDDGVRLSAETVDLLVAALMFAHEVLAGEPHDDVLKAAEHYGLCTRRPPTADEIADPDWPGHYGVGDAETVVALSPEFAGLLSVIAA